MSWLSDAASKVIGGYGNVMSKMAEYSVPGLINKAVGGTNSISDFYQNEFVNKAELRGAQAVAMASGLPIIGGLVRGIDGINQLEDLYNNAGKVPEYPGANAGASAGVGKTLSPLTRKIESGVHDLAEYYAGEKLAPLPEEGKDYITGDKYVNQ